MADLYFKIKADTTELNGLNDKINKLESKIKTLNEALGKVDNKKGAEAINRELGKLETQLQQATKTLTEMQNQIQTSSQTGSSAVSQEARSYQELLTALTTVLGSKNQNIALLTKEIGELDKVKSQLKTVQNLEAKGAITKKQAVDQKQSLIAAEIKHKAAISELRILLNAEVKETQAAETSMKQMSLTLGRLREAYRQLSEQERNSKFGKDMLADIQALDAKIKNLDATIGNHNRNVGNYKSAFNGLGMSVQQVARELPSLTMGANMFFLAISNNLPILADELKRAKEEYASLVAQGQKATPVWKQVLGSIFSWQTALVVGITLLSVYGKEVINWTKSLIKGKEAAKTLTEAQNDILGAFKDSGIGIGNQIILLNKLKGEWAGLGDSINKRKEFIDKNKSAFDELGISVTEVKTAEDLLINNTDKFIESLKLRAQAAAAQKLAAKQYEEALIKQMEADKAQKEGSEFSDKIKNVAGKAFLGIMGMGDMAQEITPEDYRKSRIQSLKDEAKQAEETADSYFKLSQAKEKEAQKIFKGMGLNTKTDKPTDDDTEPFGSLAYWNKVLNLAKEARDKAVGDEAIQAADQWVKAVESNLLEVQKKIFALTHNVAQESFDVSLNNLNVVMSKDFGKGNDIDLSPLKDAMGKFEPEIRRAINGIIELKKQWKDLSSVDKAGYLADETYKVSDGLFIAADAAELFDEQLGSVLATTASIVQGVGDMASGMAKALSGDIIGGSVGIISGIAGIAGTFKKNIEYNKKVRQEYLQGLLETRLAEEAYNQVLRERLRITQEIGETSLEYFDRLQAELKKQAPQIESEYNKIWSQLMGEQYISKTNYKHGTWFRKAKTWNDYSSLAGKSYEDIESLYTQGKLTDSAKALFEQLKQLKEEGEDVKNMIDELNQDMQNAWTATTADSISSAIIDGIRNGKRGISEFSNSFEDLMRNAMLSSLQMKYLEEPLNAFYKKFSEYSQSGEALDADEIEKLRNEYNSILESFTAQLDGLENATGISIGSSSQTATTGAFQTMSQDTGNELNGRFSALQISNEGILNETIKQTELLENIAFADVSLSQSFIDLSPILLKLDILNSILEPFINDISRSNSNNTMVVESVAENTAKMAKITPEIINFMHSIKSNGIKMV